MGCRGGLSPTRAGLVLLWVWGLGPEKLCSAQPPSLHKAIWAGTPPSTRGTPGYQGPRHQVWDEVAFQWGPGAGEGQPRALRA